jgi:hypothetical protein
VKKISPQEQAAMRAAGLMQELNTARRMRETDRARAAELEKLNADLAGALRDIRGLAASNAADAEGALTTIHQLAGAALALVKP